MFSSPAPSNVPDRFNDLLSRSSLLAGRWNSALAIYEISQTALGVEVGAMLYASEAQHMPEYQPLSTQAKLALEVQWRRTMQDRDSCFDGPSLQRDGDRLALHYVARPVSLQAVLMIVTLPCDAATAAGCSADFDEMLSSLRQSSGSKTGLLNRRELEVARWISEGKTSHEAAVILGLSEHTINEYIRSGMKKMGATNRLSFVAKTIRLGLVA